MLRPANVFGLGIPPSGGGGHEDAAAGRGRPRRRHRENPSSETMANEYIYSKDVGRAVDAAATAKLPPQIHLNIGNG